MHSAPGTPKKSGVRSRRPLIEEWLMQNGFQPVVGRRFNLRSQPMPHWNGVVDCEVLVVEL